MTAYFTTFQPSARCNTHFTGADVRRDQEGGAGCFEPTDRALVDLQDEIQKHLGLKYLVPSLELSTDSDLLLGIDDPPDGPESPISRPKKAPKRGSPTTASRSRR